MKTFLALGALAALFQSTSCLEAEVYKIRPAGGVSTRVLTDTGEPNAPLKFDIAVSVPGPLSPLGTSIPGLTELSSNQTWYFVPNPDANYQSVDGSFPLANRFTITSVIGYNISCGNQVGSPCVSSSQPHTEYSVRTTRFGTYHIIDTQSDYFLRAYGEDGVRLAAEDNSIQEEFYFDKVPTNQPGFAESLFGDLGSS
ncbi:hypothetical protein BDV40DRAFT_294529 [Aspergillus tamarii]|uniref:Uncharacterized protein n=1 Tax=Aspergillus tamarii TaxID=41984 RepID=A0A5N6VD05_ASPTM|nr:hypothetical protein BDV40DRAFT_294529 [Aspergillus tamarii]